MVASFVFAISYQFMWFSESQMHANRSEFLYVADAKGSGGASVSVGSTISSARHQSEMQPDNRQDAPTLS